MSRDYEPGDIRFQSISAPGQGTSSEPTPEPPEHKENPFPPALIELVDGDSEEKKERRDKFIVWLDMYIRNLQSSQQEKMNDWVKYEQAYRALPEPKKSFPFEGASNEVVPVGAMAVDPIVARLDTGIFKQDPVFSFKALKKSMLEYMPALEAYVDFYQRHFLKLRRVAQPRLFEFAKLGTMVFKTVYDCDESTILTYDDDNKVVERKEKRFAGPRVFGISLGDFLFPPNYQELDDCPIVVERQRTTIDKLRVAQASGKLKNVDAVRDQGTYNRTPLEDARERASKHSPAQRATDDVVVYEVWCDYDINEDGLPEHLVATYHLETRTLLALRYNWYFHQRKPYDVIPYTVTNESLLGMGIMEMTYPFQQIITRWQQMASDNAYIANIRMFIVKKGSDIEEVPRLYAGRCFFVDDPKSDFIPFNAGDIYHSTLSERQNLFGMVEKRTGVSDYLTGRESPIIGTRATATSTLALIQEGTKRVEEVLENIRMGFASIIEKCIYIWIQYGLEGLDDLAFGDDEIGKKVADFFRIVTKDNVRGALAVDLSATDAAGNRQVLQQMQLQIIQTMMGYLEKLLTAGSQAIEAIQAGQPEYADMVSEVMHAARLMFRDLLVKYDIKNPEDYLPALEEHINAFKQGQVPSTGETGAAGTPPGDPRLALISGGAMPGAMHGAATARNGIVGVPTPATPGQGAGTA